MSAKPECGCTDVPTIREAADIGEAVQPLQLLRSSSLGKPPRKAALIPALRC